MLTRNGIVIQLKNEEFYQGIEGENWSFDFLEQDKGLEEYYNNYIDVSWSDNRYVDCCIDVKYIKRYVDALLENDIEYRILLCETSQKLPVIQEYQFETVFLGYDYAYPGGSYYSCVNNDLVSRCIPEFYGIQLNKNGLFESEEEIFDFIQMRKKLCSKYPIMTFEKGDFIVYKLSEILEL